MRDVRAAAPQLAGLTPYDPKYLPADAFLSANENPADISAELRSVITERLGELAFNRYPDPLANDLRDHIAQAYDIDREQVLVGNGGDELLFNLILAWGGPGRKLLNVPPTFSVYSHNAVLTGTEIVDIPRKEDFSIDEKAVLDRVGQGDIDFVIITSPNNPTGNLADTSFLVQLLDASNALVLVDEAYAEFSGATMVPYLKDHANLVIARTFSKAYSLAGVRLGYLMADQRVIVELIKVRQPYSVDSLSQTVGSCVFEHRADFEAEIEAIIAQREVMLAELRDISALRVFPSAANYILFRVERANEVWQALYDQGVLIRDFSRAPGLENCLRVTVGRASENKKFIMALKKVLEDKEAWHGA